MIRCVVALSLSLPLLAGGAPVVAAEAASPGTIPLGESLTYRVTWLGLHCGDMVLESELDRSRPALARIEMRVRSTPWFDSIYRVRSVITSLYDPRRASTRRYHEISREQEESKDDLWVVQVERGRVRRIENEQVTTFEIPPRGVLDPLALLFRIRALVEGPGEQRSLTVMTSHGAVEANIVSQGWEQVERPNGTVPALRVVQEPVGDEEFGRGGSMTLWLSAGERRVPYRIEFDLPFGRLVATLYEEAAAPELEIEPMVARE